MMLDRRGLRFVVPLACVLARGAAVADTSCGVCHPDVRTEYADSIHAGAIDCTGCHGGDAATVGMEAHSAAAGFVGTPARQAVPAVCGSCHADAERMRAYGLPTDQYAEYRTSEHGRRLAGDARVAVCTDCHGSHGIVSADEPTSPVAPRNIPATCGRCHSDQALMADFRLPADQEEGFRRSVHGKAVLDDEHPRAPHCATCHGAHGAAAGDAGTTAAVCGHCHPRTREYFEQSPHRAVAAAGEISECVSCHGTHAIGQPSEALFDSACPECHAADSGAHATGEKLKTLLVRARESVAAAERTISDLQPGFPTVVRYRSRLQQARAHLMEALNVQHSLSVERTDDLTRTARSISEESRAVVHALGQGRQLRLLGLAAAWIFILLTVGVAILYRREKRREREGHRAPHDPGLPSSGSS